MFSGLTFLTIGIALMDSRRLVLDSIAVALGGIYLEVMLLRGLFHSQRWSSGGIAEPT